MWFSTRKKRLWIKTKGLLPEALFILPIAWLSPKESGERRDDRRKLRHRVAFDLERPIRVDCGFGARIRQVQCQVRHVKSRAVVAESQTCREHKSLRDAIVVDAVEIAELGDHLCVWLRVWVDDNDLVFLIGANP